MISAIATSILAEYNDAGTTGTALRAALAGGFWFSEAPASVSFPYGVYTWDGSNVDEICGGTTLATRQSKRIEKSSITVNLYSNKDDGGDEIFDIADKFMDHFDWCDLSITGYTHLAFRRISVVNCGKSDKIWNIEIEYEATYSH